MSKTASCTPFSTFGESDDIPRWTPFDERSDSENNENKPEMGNARKKLGFESLFDTSDPRVSEIDDVIGLCSGQFMTQKPQIETQESQNEGADIEATPDTIVMTQVRVLTFSTGWKKSTLPILNPLYF